MAQDRRCHLRPPATTALLTAFVLCGALLSLTCSSNDNSLHEDEALFGYWARTIITSGDIFLTKTVVDKPPLFIYLLALSFKLFGPSLLAARLPNILAGVVAIPLLYRLGSRLYDRETALLAALLLTLSPYTILFSPTAFTDPLMATLVLLSLLLAAEGRPGPAGLVNGLATMSKQSGLFFLPLILAVTLIASRDRPPGARRAYIARLGAGLLVALAALFLWDRCRLDERTFLEHGWRHYGGLSLTDPVELAKGFKQWADLLGYFTDSTILNTALLVGIPLLLLRERSSRRYDAIILAFVVLYLETHWLVSFNIWGRYLLGLIPLLCLLLARVLLFCTRRLGKPPRSARLGLTAALVILLLAKPAWTAAHGGYPIGSDHWAYQEVGQVTSYIWANAPPDAVIYHHYLGSYFLFYLFNSPYTIRWYKTPSSLADDVARMADGAPLYLVTPSWEDDDALTTALREQGFSLDLRHEVYRRSGGVAFSVYLILKDGGS